MEEENSGFDNVVKSFGRRESSKMNKVYKGEDNNQK